MQTLIAAIHQYKRSDSNSVPILPTSCAFCHSYHAITLQDPHNGILPEPANVILHTRLHCGQVGYLLACIHSRGEKIGEQLK